MPPAPSPDARVDEASRVALLAPPAGPVRVVVDTDAANEIDDQFAIVHTLLSGDRLHVEALYAAPFANANGPSPRQGMERSRDEILRVLDALALDAPPPVLAGATGWLEGHDSRPRSEAVDDLVGRGRAGDGPLYVIALGAPTNVACALLAAPDLLGRLVVVWLGGHARHSPDTREFNLMQDPAASHVLLDSGVPLVRVPCYDVAEHLRTTQAELDRHVRGRGAIGDLLASLLDGYHDDHYGRSKEIWDLGPGAWLIDPEWVDTVLVPSPRLTGDLTWSVDEARHLVREARRVRRDAIFGDLFRKLDRHAATA